MKLKLTNIPVYYINLDEETEKRERTESLLKSLGFESITRIPAIRHESGRIVGCARSHCLTLSQVLAQTNKQAIILEDDCELNKNFTTIIDVPDDADAVYLGISHWGRYLNHSGPYVHTQKANDECVRVFNMLATHAILYLSEDYTKMCSRIAHHYGYEIENHLDIGFAENQKYFNVYALNEPLFRQYEWSAVTTGKLSENSIDVGESISFYQKVIGDDANFYKLNDEIKSPLRQLISRRDVNGIPGYFVPTRVI